MTPHRSDEELMLAFAAGDAAAFEEIYARYAGLVLGYMRRGYRREEDVRDLAQQTFLQLHRARRDFRGDKPLRPWLMTIARNVLRDHLRREMRRPPARPLDTLLDERGAGSREPEAVALREALALAIQRLPPSLEAVVVGYWREHLPLREIARRLGTTRAAVKVRAHRAYRALRKSLEEEGYGGRDPP
jgi:RNA polymerase sigma-70 factor (ECF subfamily)